MVFDEVQGGGKAHTCDIGEWNFHVAREWRWQLAWWLYVNKTCCNCVWESHESKILIEMSHISILCSPRESFNINTNWISQCHHETFGDTKQMTRYCWVAGSEKTCMSTMFLQCHASRLSRRSITPKDSRIRSASAGEWWIVSPTRFAGFCGKLVWFRKCASRFQLG